MLPLRLELRNFMAWRELNALRLEGVHVACLSGPNGAGKSALLDAISWALWGRARGRRAEELVREGSQEMRRVTSTASANQPCALPSGASRSC